MNYNDNSNLLELLPIDVHTATATGSAVDIKDYVGKLAVFLLTTVGGGTTPTLDVKIQDSADGSTNWADVTGATFSQVTDEADAHVKIGLECNAVKRYIRAVATIAGGGSETFTFGVVAIGEKQHKP